MNGTQDLKSRGTSAASEALAPQRRRWRLLSGLAIAATLACVLGVASSSTASASGFTSGTFTCGSGWIAPGGTTVWSTGSSAEHVYMRYVFYPADRNGNWLTPTATQWTDLGWISPGRFVIPADHWYSAPRATFYAVKQQTWSPQQGTAETFLSNTFGQKVCIA